MSNRDREVRPPQKDYYQQGQGRGVEADHRSERETTEDQMLRIKLTMIYYHFKLGKKIRPPHKGIWTNRAMASRWIGSHPLPKYTITIYPWMAHVGQAQLDRWSDELGLPKHPRIEPPASQ